MGKANEFEKLLHRLKEGSISIPAKERFTAEGIGVGDFSGWKIVDGKPVRTVDSAFDGIIAEAKESAEYIDVIAIRIGSTGIPNVLPGETYALSILKKTNEVIIRTAERNATVVYDTLGEFFAAWQVYQ